jgi:hypothetical protein
MAANKLEIKVLNYNEMTPFKLNTLDFVDSAEGVIVPLMGDGRMLIVVMNGSGNEQTITLKKGTGPMGAAKDKAVTMANGELIFMAVESGLYGQTEGENRGHIHIGSTSTDIQVGCFCLPE